MKQQLRKQQFKSLLLAVLTFVPLAASAQVEINETNFPDENFRNYLLDQDYGKDGKLTEDEIKSVTYINVFEKNISSLKGIEHFTALIKLSCGRNQLTALDVSKNTALDYLECGYNQLTALDVSKNTVLRHLECQENQLTTLDGTRSTALQWLWCFVNQLTVLDVSNNTALENLECGNNQLTTLDVSKSMALENLGCAGNLLTTLDVSKNTALERLMCDNNQLTTLDVSKNTALLDLGCSYNQLTTLDISKNMALGTLACGGNQLTALDLTRNTALGMLWCNNNQLTALDLSKNQLLGYLECYGNMIKGGAMDSLIDDLPLINGLVVIYSTGKNEGNVCTKSQVAAAKKKGWLVWYYDVETGWTYEYEGSDPTGIVLPTTEAEDANTPIYDLSGKRVNNLQGKKGVYIIGGKKVLVK